MAVISGSITGVTLLRAKDSRKSYLLTVDFGAFAGADTMDIQGVGAAIASKTRNGKANTLRSAACLGAGRDSNAQAVFTGALAVSTDALTGNLTSADGTKLTSATASKGVEIVAIVDES